MGAFRFDGRVSILLFLITAAASLSPLHAVESGQKVARLGFVSPQSPSTQLRGAGVFWEHLHELGYVEGQNLIIEARWAEDQYDRLPALVAEVLGRKVDVLVTVATRATIVAQKATSTVPIVGMGLAEPLRAGLAPSLAHPSGNLTGLSLGYTEGMVGKWLELLQETVPRLSSVAVILNPDNSPARELASELQAIAPGRGVRLRVVEVRNPGALEHAFAQLGRKVRAVLVLPDPILATHRGRVTTLAAKYRLPTIYYVRDFVDAGGLIAYGPDFDMMFRRAAEYVDKILKGAKPSDLPIEQPTKFELVVNLKTAKALGLTIPESILLRADEVIR